MRRVLPTLACSMALLGSIQSHAQDFAYAITDLTNQGAAWNALRKIDLKTGEVSTVLLNGTDASVAVYDAASRTQIMMKPDPTYGTSLQTAFATGVAAAAYDAKHNRLYYTPMFIDQLRYVDLKTMKVYFVTGEGLTKKANTRYDEAKIITRMVITPDGMGYAISNDGNEFLRFSTGKNPEIVSLGALVDDQSNGGISIHNRCSSFGGDMVADEKGNLIVLTASRHVFRINTQTKVATHAGSIQGLPADFTVNGAAVTRDGGILVSSAVNGSAYYVVNAFDNWSATSVGGTHIVRSSDLANGNYLPMAQRGPIKPELVNVPLAPQNGGDLSRNISIYPNPVVNSTIVLQFNKVPAGDYTLELTDILGRTVTQQRITVNNEAQVQTLDLPQNSAKGTYLVRMVDRSSRNVYNQKVQVQ